MDLFVEGGGIVAFGGELFAVAQDVLDFLHAQAVLVEQGGAGVAGQVPVEVAGQAGLGGHLAEEAVGVLVVADVGEALEGVVAGDELQGAAPEERGEGQLQGAARLVLPELEGDGGRSVAGQGVGDEVGGGEGAEVAPAQARQAAEEEGIAYAPEPVGGERGLFQQGEFLFRQVFAARCYLRYANVAEGVVVGPYDVALHSLAHQAAQRLQPARDGVRAQVALVAHPVLPPLDDVVRQVAQAQARLEVVE